MREIDNNKADDSKDLKKKVVKGFKWSFLDNVGKFGGQFVIGLILTRILSPTDYGLIGMLAIFMVIGHSIANSGFGQALIQKQDVGKTDFSTVFYFNILISVIIYLIIFLSAPLIAKFYGEPQLIPLAKVVSINIILHAIGIIQVVHFEKSLEFKAPSLIGITSVIVSGGVSIYLAFNDFGVWALVVNSLLKEFITVVLLWKVSKLRPTWEFSVGSLKKLFSYGSKILLAGLFQSIFDNIYYLIIGRFFPVQRLGYYTRATQFKNLPVVTLQRVIHKVTYPLFSKLQEDEGKIVNAYIRVMRVLLACTMPLLVLMIVTARPFIQIILGSQWLPVAPYLQLMCSYSWIYVLYSINNQLITAKGRSDYFLYLQIIDKVLIVISIIITYKYGITALIYGHMIVTVISYLIGCIYLKKVINIPMYLQLKNIFPFIVSSLIMFGVSYPAGKIFTTDLQFLIFSIPISIAVYVIFLWIIRVEEINMAIKMIRKFVTKNSRLAVG